MAIAIGTHRLTHTLFGGHPMPETRDDTQCRPDNGLCPDTHNGKRASIID